jgi:hypothetical protein
MKHLFVIHSHISYLLAKLVINYKKIPVNDYKFIFVRGMMPHQFDTNHSLIIPWNVIPEYFPLRKNFLKSRRSILHFDNQIIKLIENKEFVAYSFDFATRLNQIIFTHILCKQKCLLEEGMMSYYPKEYLQDLYKETFSKIQKINKFLNYSNRIFSSGVIHKYLDTVYCLYEDAFSGCNKVIVYDQRTIENFYASFDYNVPQYSAIVVQDAAASFHLISESEYLSKNRELFLQLNNRFNGKIYLKFHPSQKHEERDKITNIIINDKIDFSIIPDWIPLEKYIFSNQKYEFFGFFSSVLFYACRANKESYSIAKEIKIFNQRQDIVFKHFYFKSVKSFDCFLDKNQ